MKGCVYVCALPHTRLQDKVRNMIKLGKDLLVSPPTSEVADQEDKYLFSSVLQRASGMPTLNEFEDVLSRLQAYRIAVPEIDTVLGVIQSTRAWQASLQHQLTAFHKKNESKTGKQVLESLLGKVKRAHEICRKVLERGEDNNGGKREDWVRESRNKLCLNRAHSSKLSELIFSNWVYCHAHVRKRRSPLPHRTHNARALQMRRNLKREKVCGTIFLVLLIGGEADGIFFNGYNIKFIKQAVSVESIALRLPGMVPWQHIITIITAA